MRSLLFMIYGLIALRLPRKLGGRSLRAVLGKALLGSCGSGVVIEKGTVLHQKLFLGDRVQVGADCRFMIAGRVELHDDVLLAPEVVFVDSNHSFGRLDIPIKDQGQSQAKPIVVEKGAWIGIRATILPGVRIGEGAIVGAGAVVAKTVPAYGIAIGNPARLVGSRRDVRES
jgi:maltose O-acetyltransferase